MSLLSDVEVGSFESGGDNLSESLALGHKTLVSQHKPSTTFVT